MKKNILKCALYILRGTMSFIYFFIKLFPIKPNKVLMISRQSDNVSIDFNILKDEILRIIPNSQVKILCKTIPKNLIGKIKYCFYIIKCMYHIATSNICIVEGYVIPVSALKHKKKLIIVQIWHALGAIKKFGKQIVSKKEGNSDIVTNIMKMHKNYTFVTCTSNATKEFYSEAFGIEKEKIHVLGMPRVDYLLGIHNKIENNVQKLLTEYPHLKEKKNILYVPTFRKGENVCVENVINAVNKEKYNLIIKLHPLEKTNIDYSNYTINSKYSTFDLLKVSDYIITDYSAVALEATVLNKKVFFYIYDIEKYEETRGLNINLQEEMKSVTHNNIKNIINMIEKEEYPIEQYNKFKAKYVETLDTKNSERIVKYIMEINMIKSSKIKLMNYAKKNILFRKLCRNILFVYRKFKFDLKGLTNKIDGKMIFFSSFNGKYFTDSPKAMYLYMKDNPKFKDYKFVWTFKNPENYEFLKENKNTIIIKRNSKQYEKYLAKAKYWIVNHRIADHLYPKKQQIYVQCWHGTPLKRLGCDIEKTDNVLNTLKEVKSKYILESKKIKYMVSPSKFTTEKLISSFNLKKVNKENCVIEEGYPRNDFLSNYTEDDVKNIKEKLKINNINKKIILYAPTFRDNQHESGVGYTYKTEVDFDKLQKELKDEYIILFRAHYFVSNSFDFEKYKGFIYNVSDIDDINELYIVSDILITDYSSVFFDYANLKRPIIFYMYDFENYKDEMRGFYIELNELPGEITRTEDALIKAIKETKNFTYSNKYKIFNNKFNYLDDGQASKRTVEKFMNIE